MQGMSQRCIPNAQIRLTAASHWVLWSCTWTAGAICGSKSHAQKSPAKVLDDRWLALCIEFKSSVQGLQKDWKLNQTRLGCNWTAVASCLLLLEMMKKTGCNQLQLHYVSNIYIYIWYKNPYITGQFWPAVGLKRCKIDFFGWSMAQINMYWLVHHYYSVYIVFQCYLEHLWCEKHQ